MYDRHFANLCHLDQRYWINSGGLFAAHFDIKVILKSYKLKNDTEGYVIFKHGPTDPNNYRRTICPKGTEVTVGKDSNGKYYIACRVRGKKGEWFDFISVPLMSEHPGFKDDK